MARGRYLSLEEARNAGTFIRFAKEHPSQADERFSCLLDAMSKASQEEPRTSSEAVSEDCSDIQTQPNTSEDA